MVVPSTECRCGVASADRISSERIRLRDLSLNLRDLSPNVNADGRQSEAKSASLDGNAATREPTLVTRAHEGERSQCRAARWMGVVADEGVRSKVRVICHVRANKTAHGQMFG